MSNTRKQARQMKAIQGRIEFNSRQGRGARVFVAAVTIGTMLAGVLQERAAGFDLLLHPRADTLTGPDEQREGRPCRLAASRP